MKTLRAELEDLLDRYGARRVGAEVAKIAKERAGGLAPLARPDVRTAAAKAVGKRLARSVGGVLGDLVDDFVSPARRR